MGMFSLIDAFLDRPLVDYNDPRGLDTELKK